MSLAAAKEASVDAAVVTVLSELANIFAIEEEMDRERQHVFATLPTGFGTSLVKHLGASRPR